MRYGRTKIIGNEQQFIAFMLSLISAYATNDSEYISTIVTGESSGGKTHLTKTGIGLIIPSHVKTMTAGSDKAPIYSEDLRSDTKRGKEIKIINFAELQKLQPAILEFMKSLSGDDGEFIYEVTDAAKGNTKEIPHDKKVYTVTYAQTVIDKELQTRVLLIPVDENMLINRCVAAIKLGAKKVRYKSRLYNMIPDVELEAKLVDTISSLNILPMEVIIPFPFALLDMVNHSRPESKRHAQMISSLIYSSARLNWCDRERDEDGNIIANAQDVVNVLALFDLLQATMMSIDAIDMNLFKYISEYPQRQASQLVRHLQSEGLTELTRTEIDRRLERLEDENYIIKESTTLGYTYAPNTHKSLVSMTVDWATILEYDGSVVVDPITEVEYDNIIAYSETILERMPEAVDVTKVSAKEGKCREYIFEQLSGGNSEKKMPLAHAIAAKVDNRDIGWGEVCNLLDKMVEEKLISCTDDEYREMTGEDEAEMETIKWK